MVENENVEMNSLIKKQKDYLYNLNRPKNQKVVYKSVDSKANRSKKEEHTRKTGYIFAPSSDA